MAKSRAVRALKEQEQGRRHESKADDLLKRNSTNDERCSYPEHSKGNEVQSGGDFVSPESEDVQESGTPPEIDGQETVPETTAEEFEVVARKRKARKTTPTNKSKPTVNLEIAKDRRLTNNPFTLLKDQALKKTRRRPIENKTQKFSEAVGEHEQSTAMQGAETSEEIQVGEEEELHSNVQDLKGFLHIMKNIFHAVLYYCLLNWAVSDSRSPQIEIEVPIRTEDAEEEQPSGPASIDDVEVGTFFLDSLAIQPQAKDEGTYGPLTEAPSVELVSHTPQPRTDAEESRSSAFPGEVVEILEVPTQKEPQGATSTGAQIFSIKFTSQADVSLTAELRDKGLDESLVLSEQGGIGTQRTPPLLSPSAESTDTLVEPESDRSLEKLEWGRLTPVTPKILRFTEKTRENFSHTKIDQGINLAPQVAAEIENIKGAVAADQDQVSLTEKLHAVDVEPEDTPQDTVPRNEPQQTCETSTQTEKINTITKASSPVDGPRITGDQYVQTEQADSIVQSHVLAEETRPQVHGQAKPHTTEGIEQLSRNQRRRINAKTQQRKDKKRGDFRKVHGQNRDASAKFPVAALTNNADQITQVQGKSNYQITVAVETGPEIVNRTATPTLEEERAKQTSAPVGDHISDSVQEYPQKTLQAPMSIAKTEQVNESSVQINGYISRTNDQKLKNTCAPAEATRDEAHATQARCQNHDQMLETTKRDSQDTVRALFVMDESSEVGETIGVAGNTCSDLQAMKELQPAAEYSQAVEDNNQDFEAQKKLPLWAPMSWAEVARGCEYGEKLGNWADEVEAEEALRGTSS